LGRGGGGDERWERWIAWHSLVAQGEKRKKKNDDDIFDDMSPLERELPLVFLKCFW
jgi:hypothetical protein